MTQILHGDRLGRRARLSVACAGIIFDAEHRVLLVQRRDNGRWCLPGGLVEPGENLVEACIREVEEETGLQTRVVGLVGVTTNPHMILHYADGNAFQCVDVDMACAVIGGQLHASDETAGIAYVSQTDLAMLDVMETDRDRVQKALDGLYPYF